MCGRRGRARRADASALQDARGRDGPIRYSTSGGASVGNRSASNSTSRSTGAPWRCAKEVNSRSEAVLSGVMVVSTVAMPLLGADPRGQRVEQRGGESAPRGGRRRRPTCQTTRVRGRSGPDVSGDEADRARRRVRGRPTEVAAKSRHHSR